MDKIINIRRNLNMDRHTDDRENTNINYSELRLAKKDEIKEIIHASPNKTCELVPYQYGSKRNMWIRCLHSCCCLPAPLLVGRWVRSSSLGVHQPAYPSIWPAVLTLRRGLSTKPGVTPWCVCECNWRDDMCCVCECYKGGIVVIDVIWSRLCVSMIWGRDICLFWAELGKGATSEAGKSLFRAASVWWRCEQYCVIVYCG